MNPKLVRAFAGVDWVITLALSVATIPLIVLTRDIPVDVFGIRGVDLLIAVDFATIGFLVARRRSRNPIGWLFLVGGLLAALQSFGSEYGTYSVVEHDATLPLTAPLAWAQTWLWVPMMTALGLALMLFPTGTLPSRRWRWAVALFGTATVAFSVGVGGTPGPLNEVAFDFQNPYPLSQQVSDVLAQIGGILFMASMVAVFVAVITRYRRSRGDEREQLRWLAFALAFVVIPLVFIFLIEVIFTDVSLGWFEKGVELLMMFGFAGVAVAVGLAILRYRLYDIEIVINRAVVFSVLAGFVTLVYAAIVLVPVFVFGLGGGSNIGLTLGATALVAVAFRPALGRAREIANRFIYGKRTTPYEALAGLAEARSVEDLLPRVARYAAESTTARRAIAWMSTGVELRPAACWPEDASLPPPVPLREGEPASLPGDHTYSLIHGGDLLGATTIVLGPGESLPREDHRILTDLAAHSAIALRGVLEAVELPTGIVTFLMTDVEGSTRLWEEDAGAMATALREHDALIRENVRQHEGVLIKWRGEGDSTFSVFADPERAVEAAAAIQRAFAGRTWGTPRPLRIRAALHTGKAELRERDYFGPVVNRCARLRSIAHGGQTVISATTTSLLDDQLPEGATLVDLGAQQLKDLPEPERVFELTLS